jgi:glucan 1,3-beta-glucosidase
VLHPDPPYVAAADVLDRAMDSAARHGLAVLLDLHAVSGSQNGRDHSGRVGPRRWYREREHRDHTHDALEELARRYRDHPALWGLELVNEPIDWRIWRLWRFHRRAFLRVQPLLGPATCVVFSDGYVPRLFRGNLRGGPDRPVLMDCHFYQCFHAWDVRHSYDRHLAKARGRARLVEWLSKAHPVLVGEWSAGLDPRAYASAGEPDRATLTRRYVEAQLEGYAGAIGWCYWSYTSERADDWNFRHLVETGVIQL